VSLGVYIPLVSVVLECVCVCVCVFSVEYVCVCEIENITISEEKEDVQLFFSQDNDRT